MSSSLGCQVNPYKMVFDGLDPWGIFRSHADRAALPFVKYRAPKVHDPVPYHDINEIWSRPALRLEFRIELIPNRGIIGWHWPRLGCDAC
jgi:hypothetical protein